MKKIKLMMITIFLLLILQGCKITKIIHTTTPTLEDTVQVTTTTDIHGYTYVDDVNYLENVLSYLTSRDINGRLVGSVGNEKVIYYIENEFINDGILSPEGLNYQQNYSQKVREMHEEPVLELIYPNGDIKKLEFFNDFGIVTYLSNDKIVGDLTEDLYQINDGQTQYSESDIENKVILTSLVNINKSFNGIDNFKTIFHSADGIILEYYDDVPYDYIPDGPNVLGSTSIDNENGQMVYLVTPSAYDEIQDGLSAGAKVHMAMNNEVKMVNTSNVIGYIPGTSDEYIIISAHLDHIGGIDQNTYNPGALDNASGVTALLDIAHFLSQNPGVTDKNIVFIAFNGEEEGLYGSSYYANHPIFPLNKSTFINLDMVGSKTVEPLTIDYCANVTGDALQLRNALRISAEEYGMMFDYGLDQSSDHAPMCQKGATAVTLINMDLSHGYHSPDDTIDKVDTRRLNDIINVVLYYIDQN